MAETRPYGVNTSNESKGKQIYRILSGVAHHTLACIIRNCKPVCHKHHLLPVNSCMPIIGKKNIHFLLCQHDAKDLITLDFPLQKTTQD